MQSSASAKSPTHHLKEEFCLWVRLDSSLKESLELDITGTDWGIQCLDYPEHSIFRTLAMKILSIPAGAANHERVWSSSLLTMSPKRSKLENIEF